MTAATMIRRPHMCIAVMVTVGAIFTLLLQLHALMLRVPSGLWWQALSAPDVTSPGQLAFHYVILPRFAVALLCGAALGLAGAILQQVMRNPLAEPTTLGVSAGAGLALNLATIFAPTLVASWGREWIALAGAGAAALIVFGLAWRARLSPLTLVLSGMLVTLYCGAMSAGLQLIANPYDISFYLWGAGSLAQQDWSVTLFLLPRIILLGIGAAVLARPLGLLSLEETSAKGLGLQLGKLRLAALIIATCLSAIVVSAVGVIGFVGLAAPAVARLGGARRMGGQLIWAPLTGAVLLCLTDQLVQFAFGEGREWIPTGAATAIIGAPMLLWLAPRLRATSKASAQLSVARRARHPWVLLLLFVALLGSAILFSVHVGKSGLYWHYWSGHALQEVLRWRWPRMTGALAAGMLLAAAGSMLQRITGNPLAAPEMLGISDGAACGLVIGTAFFTVAQGGQWLAAVAGAAVVLCVVFLRSRGADNAPERLLVVGVAANALASVAIAVFMVSGGPRTAGLRSWILGDTASISQVQAVLAIVVALAALVPTPLARRWLQILPLGTVTARGLGMEPGRARFTLLVLVATMTAAATIIVGPLGFVGLMGAHMARLSGLQRPMLQLAGAVLLGGMIMVLADWLGRTMMAPYELPAGLIATLIGGPYLVWLLRRA